MNIHGLTIETKDGNVFVSTGKRVVQSLVCGKMIEVDTAKKNVNLDPVLIRIWLKNNFPDWYDSVRDLEDGKAIIRDVCEYIAQVQIA